MQFVRHPQHTRYMGAPQDWDEAKNGPCDALSIHDDTYGGYRYMKSRSAPALGEAICLALGASQVELGILGNVHPPITMETMPVAGWTADRVKMGASYRSVFQALIDHAKANGFELTLQIDGSAIVADQRA